MHEQLLPHADLLLGQSECFDRERIRTAARGLDPQLVEKAVHALEYVAQLARAGTPLVFTGGTAAQVLLASRGDGDAIRLSKDVDLLSLEGTARDWRDTTASIAARFGGGDVYAVTEDPRTHGGLAIPALHFLVRYPTVFPSDARADIELDVVFGGADVPTQQTPLVTPLYRPKHDLVITTPTIGAMLGGKLTTLGPGTIGIPRTKANFDVATGKQLFDVDRLLRHVDDLQAVARSYRATYEQQVTYHPEGERPGLEAVLDDGLYVLKVLSALPGTKGPEGYWTGDLASLGDVAAKLRGYVGGAARFDRRGVMAAAARVALALVAVRQILLRRDAGSASRRWREHRERIGETQRDAAAITAAKARLREVPWELRPHIHLKSFDQVAGGEALLCWDAVFAEWT